MSSALKKMFGDIEKVEDLADGTIKVWGVASTEAQDVDGEIVKASAIKSAIPDYMRFGAVREMHQPKAAGTALEVDVDSAGITKICAHIVDSEAIKKVKTGVYKGFSIGGKVTGRDEINKTIVTGVKLTEISLVDRPANPEAVITMYKADMEKTELKQVWMCSADKHTHLKKSDALECEQCAKNTTIEPAKTSANPKTEKLAHAAWAKGMYTLSSFAEVLSMLQGITRQSFNEREYEKDDSDIPERLRAILVEACDVFVEMSNEETGELADTITDPDLISLCEGAKAMKNLIDDLKKGDYAGHPFHGNQHTGGAGREVHKASKAAHEATKAAHGESSKANHHAAAKAHKAAAKTASKHGETNTAKYHEHMASYHEGRANRFSKAEGVDDKEASTSTGEDHAELAKGHHMLGDLFDNSCESMDKVADVIGAHHSAVAQGTSKADIPEGEDKLAKLASGFEELKKSLEKSEADKAELAARLEKIEKQPVQAKGALKVIEKGQDTTDAGDGSTGITPVFNDNGTVNEVATMMKIAQTRPIRIG